MRLRALLVAVVVVLASACQEGVPTEVDTDAGLQPLHDDGGPGFVIVHPSRPGFPNTIAEGLARVADGGTVLVTPGTYEENVLLTRPVRLQGTRRGSAVIAPAAGPAIRVATTGKVVIRRLTLDGDGGVNVAIPGADVLVEKLRIFGEGFAVFSAFGGERTRLVVRGSLIDGGPDFEIGSGIFVAGNIDALILGNVVRRINGFSCIQAQGDAVNVRILLNHVDECTLDFPQGAIEALMGPGSTVKIVGNRVRNSNHGPSRIGIEFRGAQGRIERNRIIDYVQPGAGSRSGAIVVSADGTPDVRFNDLAGNATAGLRVLQSTVIDATCNWWGAADGPSGDGPGSGDAVLGPATFIPFAARPVAEDRRRKDCAGGL